MFIKYIIGEEKKIRLFGKTFVENNKRKLKMKINCRLYPISQFYELNNKELNDKYLEIILTGTNYINNISYMFANCSSL